MQSIYSDSVSIIMPLPFFLQLYVQQHSCLHLTSKQCPFFHNVSSVYCILPTAPPSFPPAEFVYNCPTYCTCDENIVAYHHFSFQPLERNFEIFSRQSGKYSTVTSTFWSTERDLVVWKHMQVLMKCNLW